MLNFIFYLQNRAYLIFDIVGAPCPRELYFMVVVLEIFIELRQAC